MDELATIPEARPVHSPVTHVPDCVPVAPEASCGTGGDQGRAIVQRRTDKLAVASAVCGFTALVPIISQVIGLGLGVVSLGRIRRAKRQGVELGGMRWAVAGIVSSGFMLLCWIGIFVAMALLTSSFAGSAESLGAALRTIQ